MGVDLEVAIVEGYVFPQSIFTKKFWEGDREFDDDVRVLTQDCYGTRDFLDEPMVAICICESTIFFAKTGAGDTPITENYFPFANGGRLPITLNLNEHGSTVDMKSAIRAKIDKIIKPYLESCEMDPKILDSNTNYSRWLYSYFW
eukprot:Pompholyxophrys_sp_v1_NODE_3_length_18401_cov_4.332280.p12 type:complete len:145 gc:universal NODE_3_length_18401_cov_4.332280:9394-9828(+)